VKGLLITLVVLVGLAVVADRVGVRIAEKRVAEQIQQRAHLAGTPEVDITGVPFLTQAIAGTYSDVRISLSAADLGQPAGTSADVSLRGVHVPLSDVLSGSVQKIPVDRVNGTATLSYALLSSKLGGDTTLRREGNGLRITKTVQIAGVTLPLTAVGTVRLSGNDLLIDVQKASGVGVQVPGFLVDRVSALLDLRYTIPALPFGLKVTGVAPGPDGVVVSAAASDTVLSG
jgi:DUF2993 family protein